MEFYEAVGKRRTVREFTDKEIPEEVLVRVLEAGLKAPTGTPIKDIEFVVIRGKTPLLAVCLEEVRKTADHMLKMIKHSSMDQSQQEVYLQGIPKQYRMLSDSGCLLLPFYKQKGELLAPETQSSLNGFASVWCCIENILLAAVAEGLACSIRVPVGEEENRAAKAVHAPEGYVLPCFIGIGYPADNAEIPPQAKVDIHKKIHFDKWDNVKR
ncbi:MAG: nitroreductase family protein [Spirochaetaceae bacterium]|jgi:nitroreductase|nr:nitroreductase family protein [Spirochaetaceae bacterium]